MISINIFVIFLIVFFFLVYLDFHVLGELTWSACCELALWWPPSMCYQSLQHFNSEDNACLLGWNPGLRARDERQNKTPALDISLNLR